MVTVQDRRRLKNQIQAAGQGEILEVDFIDRVNEKRQWYRQDGTPLPTLLPADQYHFEKFTAKGWTLTPPSGPELMPSLPKTSRLEEEVRQSQHREWVKKQEQALLAPGAMDPIPQERLVPYALPFYNPEGEIPVYPTASTDLTFINLQSNSLLTPEEEV